MRIVWDSANSIGNNSIKKHNIMSKYLKLFNNHSEYDAFTGSTEFITPNVSLCIEENDVHYNPKPKVEVAWVATFSDGHTLTGECNQYGYFRMGMVPESGAIGIQLKDCVTKIDEEAFMDNGSLTAITIPAQVTEIGKNAFYNLSSNCQSVTFLQTTMPYINNDNDKQFKNYPNPIYVQPNLVNSWKSALRDTGSNVQPIP